MDKEKVVCLVAGAGRGLRFGREMPKGFYPVEGRTLLALSIEKLAAWKGISEFVVMVPPDWEDKAGEILSEELPGMANIRVVTGGETRQRSVAIGLEAAGEADIVMIHDACRPFVSPQLIERVVSAAREYGAAVPALQVTDTLGRIRDEDLEAIVPRERVVGIQTPQAFRMDILRKAYETAGEAIGEATDESSLVIAAGMQVKAVEGERWNIKVTVKDDLGIISSFMKGSPLELPDSLKE